jgi:hypothetical protein
MPKHLTVPIDPTQAVIGYIVNTGLSEALYRPIRDIQAKLDARFPGAIWAAPQPSLHITLMDWSSPLAGYDQDKDELFRSVEGQYVSTLTEALKGQGPIPIAFDTIEAHPAAIIVKGHDDGSYQRIRDQFLSQVELLPGTKPPPHIVHTTICKFLQPIDVGEVEEFLRAETLRVQEIITEFRLVRETQIFLMQYETLRRFKLQ